MEKQENQDTKNGLKIVDKVDEDIKKIVDERNELKEELQRVNGAFNVALVTSCRIIFQPFVGKQDLGDTEIEYSHYFLSSWLRPIAVALAGSDRNKAYVKELAAMVGKCFASYCSYYRIATSQHSVKHDGIEYDIYEEGGAPFVKQVEPEEPKSEFDGASLFVLLAAPEKVN